MEFKRFIIIGGGLVGLASALKLAARFPGCHVVVLEKEAGVGRHQSGNNSGVLHAGLYYKPGSLKARLAVAGIREMTAFCRDNGIAHEICGKLVVAVDESELERLRHLYERGQQNGLQGLRMLDAGQMREIEPHAGGIAALHVPQEGIVDYTAVCRVMARKIEEGGGRVATRAKVIGLREQSGGWAAQTTAGDWEGDYLVNCGGLHCDRVGGIGGGETGGAHCSLSRRVFQDQTGAAIPGAEPDLSGARSAISFLGSSFHAAD